MSSRTPTPGALGRCPRRSRRRARERGDWAGPPAARRTGRRGRRRRRRRPRRRDGRSSRGSAPSRASPSRSSRSVVELPGERVVAAESRGRHLREDRARGAARDVRVGHPLATCHPDDAGARSWSRCPRARPATPSCRRRRCRSARRVRSSPAVGAGSIDVTRNSATVTLLQVFDETPELAGEPAGVEGRLARRILRSRDLEGGSPLRTRTSRGQRGAAKIGRQQGGRRCSSLGAGSHRFASSPSLASISWWPAARSNPSLPGGRSFRKGSSVSGVASFGR